MKWRILLAGLMWLPTAAAQAAPATQPTAERHRQLVAELYEKRIAQAQASDDPTDDVALSREMLLAAADSVNPPGLRYLLAMEAVKLAAPVGSADAAKLAREALALADKLQPLGPIEKCRLEVQIARRRYAFAREDSHFSKKHGSLAAEVIKAKIALAKALIGQKKVNEAGAILTAARTKAITCKLRDLQADIEEVTEALKAVGVLVMRIRTAEAQLERAKRSKDGVAIKAARENLGLIYLLAEGDIPKADSYLAGTGHQYESPVAAAKGFLKDSRKIPPTAAACNKAIEDLGLAAKSAKNKQAQVRIATVAMNMARALLARKPAGLEATKVRLLLGRMEHLAGESPADKFIRRLRAKYGGLAGKIEVVKGNLVRFSYDFTRRKQLGDWQIKEGNWIVAKVKGQNILGATPPRHERARLISRLRFRADKPLLFTFRASGRQNLTGIMYFLQENNPAYRSPYRLLFEFGDENNHNSILRERGWRVWSDRRVKVTRNTIHRIEIAWDGAKSVTWTINGKVLCKHEIRYRKEDLPYTSLFVGLKTYDRPAGFDDVTVEGVILEDPSKQLSRPEPERPEREWPRRRRRY